MKQIKRLFVISAMTCVLAGCHLISHSPKVEVKPSVDVTEPDDTEVIETPPQIVKQTDWNTILSPFVNKILHVSLSNNDNKIILISDIQNRSGDYLVTNQIDDVLHQLMNKQNMFTVVNRQSTNQAKQALGISADDKFVSRGKMIGLAKSINAGYVLFTTIYKVPTESNDANLSVELLSTQSGEILTRVTSKDFSSQQNTNKDNVSEAHE
ncbi:MULTISPECIES: hypothetical protein [unclassified Gilliamella]|uniref:hypothetical protein n=1 Tax=unclassified Gilliamella TaxID=2685620 RepID=UPI00080DEE80|nr:hypothetical protein [Gilliamella apicola]OCG18721.1 hypothetical protein A9G23_09965 [Gilliamella apicola]OCG24938.1 hypothetical protein A9G22_03130 [Gilliamella apicola]